jgi:hypothetical protein
MLANQVDEADWLADGSFRVRWAGGEEVVVPRI